MMKEHGDDCYIVELSGTPAPKSPTDWWHQCEIACPGYIKEGNVHRFKQRLCLIEQRESLSGGVYPHVVTWFDDAAKCAKCGELQDHDDHKIGDPDFDAVANEDLHTFEPSCNEVEALGRRLKGLVDVRFKADCLDLPEMRFEIIKV